MTLPIGVCWQVALGASLAWASPSSLRRTAWWRSVALWALVAFEGLVVVPVGGYFLAEFPAWTLMYAVDPARLPAPLVGWVVLYPLVGLVSFGLARRLLGRLGAPAVALLCVAGVGGTVGLLVWRWEALQVVSSFAAFWGQSAERRALIYSPLAPLLAVHLPALVFGWLFVLWRLFLMERTLRLVRRAQERAPLSMASHAVVPVHHTRIAEPKREN